MFGDFKVFDNELLGGEFTEFGKGLDGIGMLFNLKNVLREYGHEIGRQWVLEQENKYNVLHHGIVVVEIGEKE